MAELRLAAAIAACCVSACCTEPWQAFPEKTPPDTSCSTGDVHGHDVYIWNCLRGQRVVIAQYTSEMSCRAPVREVSACGAKTPLETSLALTSALCSGPRSGRGWR